MNAAANPPPGWIRRSSSERHPAPRGVPPASNRLSSNRHTIADDHPRARESLPHVTAAPRRHAHEVDGLDALYGMDDARGILTNLKIAGASRNGYRHAAPHPGPRSFCGEQDSPNLYGLIAEMDDAVDPSAAGPGLLNPTHDVLSDEAAAFAVRERSIWARNVAHRHETQRLDERLAAAPRENIPVRIRAEADNPGQPAACRLTDTAHAGRHFAAAAASRSASRRSLAAWLEVRFRCVLACSAARRATSSWRATSTPGSGNPSSTRTRSSAVSARAADSIGASVTGSRGTTCKTPRYASSAAGSAGSNPARRWA